MSFIWNSFSAQYFQTIIDQIIKNNKIDHGFLLLCGPQYIGKTTLIQSQIEKIVPTQYQMQDYIMLQDFSDQRLELKDKNDKLSGTSHSIKIEMDANKADIKLEDGSIYKDLGIRETIDRLQKSPIGGKKLLVIENIERMGIGACNALLKTLEEPLSDRLIICTCSDSNAILPTILSRWLVINFYPVPDWELEMTHTKSTSLQACMGRPGLLKRFETQKKFQELFELYKTVDLAFWENELLSTKQQIFTKANELWLFELFLDMLVMKFSNNQTISESIIQAKKHLESNVNINNAILNMLL